MNIEDNDMNIELFEIIRRELAEDIDNDKEYLYSKVANINTLKSAIEITEVLNKDNNNKDIIYFYRNKD